MAPVPLRWLVSPGTKVQVDPAALRVDLVDLALAVVLTGAAVDGGSAFDWLRAVDR